MADARLQQHCDQLNALQWVRASGNPYVVVTDDDGSHRVARRNERAEKPTPHHQGKAA